MNFYSQSFNFTSSAQGKVDPRTGLFSVNMPLAHLVGNNNLGPTLDLTLNYNPLQKNNSGFGIGCSIGTSHYDTKARLLTLSTGERYKVTETNTQPVVEQKKLDSFRFEKEESCYKVIYKSGVIEILSGPKTANDLKVPLEIYSPTGHKLTLKWKYFAGKPRLSSVSDQKSLLLQISYPGDDYVDTKVKVWPGTQEAHEMMFSFKNDHLVKLQHRGLSTPLLWKFDYDQVGQEHYIITQVTAPTGFVERVYYKPECMRFPKNAALSALPAVIRYVQSPGVEQPHIEARYDYSGYNYLGHGSTVDWSPDRDNLYGILDGYEYHSYETLIGKDHRVETKRTYNNFHLLTQEQVIQGTAFRISQTDYYALAGKSFDKQPAQFQLPKKQTITYQDSSKPRGEQIRNEVTITEFDQAGNLIKKITPDGTATLLEYYKKEGEGNHCPASPNGFVRFLKRKTICPARSDFPTPTQSISYTYISFLCKQKSPLANTVLLKQEEHYSDEKLLLDKTTGYIDDPTSSEHGRIKKIKRKRYDLDTPEKSYTTQEDFNFKIEDERLLQEATFTGHDGLSSTIKKEHSLYSGKLLLETDEQGNKTIYEYDQLGRILKHIFNQGTEYENTLTTTYNLVKDDQELVREISTTETDTKGNKKRTYFDGMGRVIKQVHNDVDWAAKERASDDANNPKWFETLKQEYNDIGRKVRIKTTDHALDPTQASTDPEETSLTAELSYSDWGGNHQTNFTDGHNEYTIYNPVSMESIQYMQIQQGHNNNTIAQGKRKIKYNLQRRPIRIEDYYSNDKLDSVILQQYDGLGRLCRVIDELHQITHYTYDALGRVTTQRLPDGTLIKKTYVQHTSKPLVSIISVVDDQGKTFVLGRQSFDSLNRLSNRESGGRKYLYHYEGASPKPSKVITPKGETLNYHYIPELNNALERLEYKVEEETQQQTFAYDQYTGLLTEAHQSGSMRHSMQYTSSGLLKSENFTTAAGDNLLTNYDYSLLGAPRSYTDVSGARQSYRYDQHNRHILTEDPLVRVEFQYDGLGRLIERKATNKSNGTCMKTIFSYDDFNREIKRKISFENNSILSIEYSYRANNQFSSRTTKRDEQTLRKEDFGYDRRNRLTQYHCSGGELPVDAYGKSIQKQEFTYDALGNIKSCFTEFEGGSDTASFHYDNAQDPTQLTSLSHSHGDYPKNITLEYDANGRLIHDEASRTLSYDPLGRLVSLNVEGVKRGEYSYDALDRLVGQKVSENDRRELYYLGDILVNEIHHKDGKKHCIRLIKEGNATMAISSSTLELTATDGMGSLLSAVSAQGAREDFCYAPYGSTQTRSSVSALVGFNGERMDPISGTYHLGNGYRAYNPALMRFNCPDSLSPFGAGGISSYVYCLGDPINRMDPSGHMSAQDWVAIGLGVVGILGSIFTAGTSIAAAGGLMAAVESASASSLITGGLSVAADVSFTASAALQESNPRASAILGWVSLGGMGAGSLVGSLAKRATKSTSSLSRAAEPLEIVEVSSPLTRSASHESLLDEASGYSAPTSVLSEDPVKNYSNSSKYMNAHDMQKPPNGWGLRGGTPGQGSSKAAKFADALVEKTMQPNPAPTVGKAVREMAKNYFETSEKAKEIQEQMQIRTPNECFENTRIQNEQAHARNVLMKKYQDFQSNNEQRSSWKDDTNVQPWQISPWGPK